MLPVHTGGQTWLQRLQVGQNVENKYCWMPDQIYSIYFTCSERPREQKECRSQRKGWRECWPSGTTWLLPTWTHRSSDYIYKIHPESGPSASYHRLGRGSWGPIHLKIYTQLMTEGVREAFSSAVWPLVRHPCSYKKKTLSRPLVGNRGETDWVMCKKKAC